MMMMLCKRWAISPQAWGCTLMMMMLCKRWANLPTGVGMYRPTRQAANIIGESPHRRGDVPGNMMVFELIGGISPQAWGCTDVLLDNLARCVNLPTGVGMYRRSGPASPLSPESPHRRGDVPGYVEMPTTYYSISPQAWGCTGRQAYRRLQQANLPTGVGMYRFIESDMRYAT